MESQSEGREGKKKLKINDDALSIAPGDICILPTE